MILQPAQGETRAEGITSQPTRTICSRRPNRFLAGRKKVRANPEYPRLRSGPHTIPIGSSPQKAGQGDNGSVHGTTRRSKVSR